MRASALLFAAIAVAAATTGCGFGASGSGSSGNESDAGVSTDGGSGSAGGQADAGQADAGTPGGGGQSDAGGSGGGTVATGPQTLAAGENAFALAIDADNVYWLRHASSGGTDVRSVPKAGGTVLAVVHTTSLTAQALIAPGGPLMWEGTTCAPPCDYPGASREWEIFADAGDGTARMVARLDASGGLAATATTAFSRSLNSETGRWNLLRCARDGSGCANLESDLPLAAPVYFDSDKLYFVEQPTDTDDGPRSLLCNQMPEPPFASGGCLTMHDATGVTGLRVNGNVFALRANGSVWTGSVDGSLPLRMIWGAPNGDDVDISHGRVYWTQSANSQFQGCLGSANLDGTDGKCLEQGSHTFGGVRVDETAVYYARDGDIIRLLK